MPVVEVAALPHQRLVLDSPARFKLVRWGRRGGKSRCGLIAAVAGHGPSLMYPGIMHGAHIAWLAPDYHQALALWREEIKPRFQDVAGFTVSEGDRSVS